MKCIVKGTNGIPMQIEFTNSTTVLEVKKYVQDLQGTHFSTFMLVFGGKVLKDNLLLKDYDIASNSIIQCIEKTEGGYYKSK